MDERQCRWCKVLTRDATFDEAGVTCHSCSDAVLLQERVAALEAEVAALTTERNAETLLRTFADEDRKRLMEALRGTICTGCGFFMGRQGDRGDACDQCEKARAAIAATDKAHKEPTTDET